VGILKITAGAPALDLTPAETKSPDEARGLLRRRSSRVKVELREAIKDPGRLQGDELLKHVQYEDGSPEAFLRRLWRDLQGGELVDTREYPERNGQRSPHALRS
jgi:hypothetical protein